MAECDEGREFAPETLEFEVRALALRQAIEADCAVVRFLGDRVEASWAWQFSCRAPKRNEHPRTVLTLGPGEWGRIEYNGRYSSLAGMAGWKYHRRVINVALVEEVGAVVFEGRPVKEFRSLAELR